LHNKIVVRGVLNGGHPQFTNVNVAFSKHHVTVDFGRLPCVATAQDPFVFCAASLHKHFDWAANLATVVR
jgi:hypothetical protein